MNYITLLRLVAPIRCLAGGVKNLDYGMDYRNFRRIWRFYLLLLGTIFEPVMESTMVMGSTYSFMLEAIRRNSIE